jgi:hypothetical protein
MKPVMLSLLFAAFNNGVAAAASGARDDNSSIFIWIFFGMTGLIVAVLLVPALRLLLGIIGSVEDTDETVEEKVPRS